MSYTDEAQALRDQYVRDAAAQAPTVQGELIRSIDALRAAAIDGNEHRTKDHDIMVDFLREILCGGALFEAPIRDQLDADLDAIAVASPPETSPEPYDRVAQRIVDWDRLHPDLMPHHPNPALTI
jgi:hypothetical protein